MHGCKAVFVLKLTFNNGNKLATIQNLFCTTFAVNEIYQIGKRGLENKFLKYSTLKRKYFGHQFLNNTS